MKKNLLAITMVIGMAIVLTSCGGKGAKKADAQSDANSKVSVKVEEAAIIKVAQTVDFTANTQAYYDYFIIPAVQGTTIDKIYVEVGQRVRKGQVLVDMDKTQYNTVAIQLSQAELNLARMLPVYEAGGIPKSQIDDLQANINILKESERNLRTNLTFRSPIDGIVTARYYENGSLFSMSSPNPDGTVGILRVMQIDRLKTYVNVSEQYFSQVTLGMPVSVVAEAVTGKTFEGKVTRIAPAINPATHTFEVEVTLPNTGMELRPGMYARSTFDMGEVDGITVLDMAIQRQAGTNDKYVFTVKNGVVEKHFVTTGRQVGDRIEILSGVSEGDMVVIAGTTKITAGASVDIIQ